MVDTRIASDPKAVARAALRCSVVIFFVPWASWSVSFRIPTNLPCASNARTFSSRSAAACCFVGDASDISIVFSEVPASEPLMPFFANRASDRVVSSIDMPMLFATAPACDSPMPRSWAEPDAAPAPWARRSATLVASRPFSPNMFSELATKSDASPSCMLSAPARAMVPRRASIESWVDKPALPRFSSPTAASVAVNWPNSCPASRAALRSRPSWASVAPVDAATFDICASKSAAFFTSPTIPAPSPPVMTIPARVAPRAMLSMLPMPLRVHSSVRTSTSWPASLTFLVADEARVIAAM